MAAARSIPLQEWEAHKTAISELYLNQNCTLNEVIRTMENNYGFQASKAQYVRKLKRWKIEKNSTCDKWKFASIQTQKRKLEGKETEITINGKPISAKKLRKEMSRYTRPQLAMNEEPDFTTDVQDSVHVRTPPKDAIEHVGTEVWQPLDSTTSNGQKEDINLRSAYSCMSSVVPHVDQAAHSIEFSHGMNDSPGPVVECRHLPWFQFQDLIDSLIVRFANTAVTPNDSEGLNLSSCPVALNQVDFDSRRLNPSNPSLASSFQQDTLSPNQPLPEENHETVKLLGKLFDISADPESPDDFFKILDRLKSIAIERYSGEFGRQLQRLYIGSAEQSTFQLLRYAVYLSSNNLLRSKTKKLLAWAVRSGKTWAIKHIIQVNMPTTEIFSHNILVSAARVDAVDLVCILLKKGVDYNGCPDWEGETPLEAAIITRSVAVVKLLLEAGADVNNPDYDYDHTKLLQFAIEQGNVELTQKLLKAGALVNEVTPAGTALQRATLNNNIELVEVLLDSEADVNIPIGEAYEYACGDAIYYDDYDFFLTPLQHASAQNNTEMVQILLDSEADVNDFPAGKFVQLFELSQDSTRDFDYYKTHCQDDSDIWQLCTALQLAASNKNNVLVRLLLSHGAEIDAVGARGTALQISA